ncbi:Leucine-rich repeat - like 10, partial [Theobroma cacao]
KPPEKTVKLNAPDLEGFATLQRSLQEILELLRSDKLKGIEIFGTEGVGKTTILKNLNNHEEVAKMFDVVIWINVSRERNDEKLQLNIAQRLKLKVERATCSGELARIISEYMKHKKYLLLLNEVMDSIDLLQIGISDMIAAEKIDLPDVEPVARLVVDECDRLPLVIRTVASSFKLKDSDSEWRNGLSELEKWPKIEIPGLTKMYAALKFCYDELKDEKKKKCFLYGALYPADSKIYTDYLLECWAAEGLLGNIDDGRSLRDARDKGYDILGHLTNAKKISMIEGKLHDLPESPNCNKLLSLLLQKNPDLVTIPPSFFKNMQKLLVLDLYQTGIASLPSSVSKLIRLKALFLNDCPNVTKLPPQVAEL